MQKIREDFLYDIAELNKYMKEKEIDIDLQKNVIKYIEYFHHVKLDHKLTYDYAFRHLPQHLKDELK